LTRNNENYQRIHMAPFQGVNQYADEEDVPDGISLHHLFQLTLIGEIPSEIPLVPAWEAGIDIALDALLAALVEKENVFGGLVWQLEPWLIDLAKQLRAHQDRAKAGRVTLKERIGLIVFGEHRAIHAAISPFINQWIWHLFPRGVISTDHIIAIMLGA